MSDLLMCTACRGVLEEDQRLQFDSVEQMCDELDIDQDSQGYGSLYYMAHNCVWCPHCRAMDDGEGSPLFVDVEDDEDFADTAIEGAD